MNHDFHQSSNHNHTLYDELICHIPYAVFSVAFGLIVLSFLAAFYIGDVNMMPMRKSAKILFHSFHFIHFVIRR